MKIPFSCCKTEFLKKLKPRPGLSSLISMLGAASREQEFMLGNRKYTTQLVSLLAPPRSRVHSVLHCLGHDLMF